MPARHYRLIPPRRWSAMPKGWVHQKRRGTRPPNSPGCRTPPPQKLRQQKTKNPPKIAPEGTRYGNTGHSCSRPMKDTKHRESHTTDTNGKHYRRNNNRDKAERETDQSLTPHTERKQKTKKVGDRTGVVANEQRQGDAICKDEPHGSCCTNLYATYRRGSHPLGY